MIDWTKAKIVVNKNGTFTALNEYANTYWMAQQKGIDFASKLQYLMLNRSFQLSQSKTDLHTWLEGETRYVRPE